MKCVYCNGTESRVIDSRSTEDGNAIRRRRECESCGRRFTTYEKIDMVPLMVIKKDRRREPFDSEKLRLGLIKACEKRPISVATIDEMIRDIEMRAFNEFDQEITTRQLGEMVIEHLQKIDEIAYVRFASVYRQFADIQTFMDELGKLIPKSD